MFGYFSQMGSPIFVRGLFTRVSCCKINGIAPSAIPPAICSRIRGRDGGGITGSAQSPQHRTGEKHNPRNTVLEKSTIPATAHWRKAQSSHCYNGHTEEQRRTEHLICNTHLSSSSITLSGKTVTRAGSKGSWSRSTRL